MQHSIFDSAGILYCLILQKFNRHWPLLIGRIIILDCLGGSVLSASWLLVYALIFGHHSLTVVGANDILL